MTRAATHHSTRSARSPRHASALAAACLTLVVIGNGCSTTGGRLAQAPAAARAADREITQASHTVVRGQSMNDHAEGHPGPLSGLNGTFPQAIGHGINPVRRDHLPHTPLGSALHNHLHNTQVSYHDASTPICGGTGQPGDPMCPSCPGGGCPTGYGMYGGGMAYGGMGGCPTGMCGAGCNGGCVRNHHTYRVEQPKNLVYPQAGAVGGAVVYPYYTHKGPSDFFRE